MINAKLKSENIFYFTIDTSIFGESVITKVLYWYTEFFDIYWSKKSDSVHEVILKLKPNTSKSYTFAQLYTF